MEREFIRLKRRFLKDNSELEDFQKLVAEFYFDVQELAAKDPRWAERISKLANEGKIRRKEFESRSGCACEKTESSPTLEPNNS